MLFQLAMLREYVSTNTPPQGTGLIPLRADGRAFMVPDQLNSVSDSNLAAPDHVTIQGKRALESPHDVCKDLTVLFQTIGIECGHDAAPTKVLYPDDDVSDVQALPGP